MRAHTLPIRMRGWLDGHEVNLHLMLPPYVGSILCIELEQLQPDGAWSRTGPRLLVQCGADHQWIDVMT
jgi:hypothetical protein